jgi:hypothetical protein
MQETEFTIVENRPYQITRARCVPPDLWSQDEAVKANLLTN